MGFQKDVMQIKIGADFFRTFTDKDKALSNLGVTGSATATRFLSEALYTNSLKADSGNVCNLLTVSCLDAKASKIPCIFGVETITPSEATGVVVINGELQANVISSTGIVEGQELHLTGDDGNVYSVTITVDGSGTPSLSLTEVTD